MDKLRKALSGNDQCDEESGFMNQIMDESTLSWSTRIKSFAFCFVIGVLLSLLGAFEFFLGNIHAYAILYALGSTIQLLSTCLLMGPFKQLQKMFASKRIIATVIALASIFMTIFVAVKFPHKPVLALFFIIIQFFAMTWYSLSYIPYARDAVKKTVEACIT
ncbi:hypothetical protein HCN44_000458 [Aphidius gifuensis]|uniref:Vesicle transport protein n=2 Tax=Aphidius gifuensis TaxID=684658 RepID=A0A834XQB9_APHGI|nr:vesicle transport protein SFT2A isoform X2 [Aphidius gifuensis]KAF7990653.1 hypothetical protein HCN44_000458 [Aphidius gifuensis]